MDNIQVNLREMHSEDVN